MEVSEFYIWLTSDKQLLSHDMHKKLLVILIPGLENAASSEIYVKTVLVTEKLNHIINLGIMFVSFPLTMLPKFVLSFLNYLTTDLDGDAFELPFPYW